MKKEIARIEKIEAQRKKEEAKKIAAEEKREYNFEKSRVASEKLQLAWVKANITFTGVGFAVYKFYQSRKDHGQSPLSHFITGRELGIFLSIASFFVLLIATIQHIKKMAYLKSKYGKEYRSIALMVSYFILVFTLVVVTMILFHF